MKSEPTPIYPPGGYAPNQHAPSPYGANPYAQANAYAPPAPLNQQYRSHAAPAFTPAPTFNPAPAQDRPQFATFESPSRPVNEDALPAMPSWGDARDRHVEVEEPAPVPQKRGDMEMDRLNHNGSVSNASMTGMTAVPRRSPVPARSPVSPVDGYGHNQGFESEPLVGAAPYRSQHNSPAPYGRPHGQQEDYRRGSPAQNLSPVDGYAQNQPYGRQLPAQQPQQYQQHDQYDHYDQHDHQSGYASVPPSYHSSPPPPAQGYQPSYDDFAPAPVQQQRSHTPGYPHSGTTTTYEPSVPAAEPVSAYPGQRSYTPQTAYPGQPAYQAFNPGQTGPQASGVIRKAVDGSYRDI
jgi:hypothetical protein